MRLVQEQRAALEKQLAALHASAAQPLDGATATGANGLAAPSASRGAHPAAPVPSISRGGLKRPPPVGEPPFIAEETRDAKRARFETERARRVISIFNQCATIIKGLRKCKDSWPFQHPVDPVKLNIPDYFNIVKKPMDLGTVMKKLDHKPEKGLYRTYNDVYEFRDDVRLVWYNCRLYNQPGQAVRNMGDNLSEMWEKRWQQSGIEAKWEEELRRQKAEDMELDGKTDVQGAEIPKKLQELNSNLKQLQAKVESQDRPKPIVAPPNRDMTFEEKRKLSQVLSMFPPDKLDDVVAIVAGSVQPQPEADDEIELDIDALDNVTLWKLDKYVKDVLGTDKKGQVGGAHAGPPAEGGKKGGKSIAAEQEQETTSKHATCSGAAAGAGRSAPKGSDDSSSSSSSSSGDSSSEGSDEEVGSRENVGSTFGDGRRDPKNKGNGDGAGDLTTLVSATRPAQHQAQILKSSTQRKEPTVTNAAAWTALAATAGPGNAEEDGDKANADDELWKEFKTRAEHEEKLAKEKREEEEQRQEAREQEARKAREESERLRRQKEEEEERLRKEEEERREREKAAEKAQLEGFKNRVDLTSQQAMMKDFDAAGGAAGGDLAALGLVAKPEDDESEDSDEEEDI